MDGRLRGHHRNLTAHGYDCYVHGTLVAENAYCNYAHMCSCMQAAGALAA